MRLTILVLLFAIALAGCATRSVEIVDSNNSRMTIRGFSLFSKQDIASANGSCSVTPDSAGEWKVWDTAQGTDTTPALQQIPAITQLLQTIAQIVGGFQTTKVQTEAATEQAKINAEASKASTTATTTVAPP
jgi:hypothetical protein